MPWTRWRRELESFRRIDDLRFTIDDLMNAGKSPRDINSNNQVEL